MALLARDTPYSENIKRIQTQKNPKNYFPYGPFWEGVWRVLKGHHDKAGNGLLAAFIVSFEKKVYSDINP